MLDHNFIIALSSSFWIIPREGTEALLVVLMLCSALRESGRSNAIGIVIKNCWAAVLLGIALAIGCVELKHIFTGQSREMSEAIASLVAMSMLLYVNFSMFQANGSIKNMSTIGLGSMAFISVFREIAEVILFYFALFNGSTSQQAGTGIGIILGMLILAILIYLYKNATEKWKKANRIIFNITPFMFFMLALMCIGNAINSFQEAGVIGFTPINLPLDNNFIHSQSSVEYTTAATIFICSTGLLFTKQFIKSIKNISRIIIPI